MPALELDPAIDAPAAPVEALTELGRAVLAECDPDERPRAATACVVVRDEAGRTVAIRDVCLTSP